MRAIHMGRLYQTNMKLQNECQILINGYQELVHLDSSLIPLESLRYLINNEILNMTMGMVKKDLSWHNLQFSEALHHL